MNEKTSTSVSSEKEKVKESQSRSVTPSLDTPSGVGLGASQKHIGNRRPKSTRLPNEMDVREGKTTITCGLCKQLGHNWHSCKNRNKVQ